MNRKHRRWRQILHLHLRQDRRDRVLWSLAVLTPIARNDGRNGPSIRQLSQHSKVSRGEVERVLREFRAAGMIEKHWGEHGGVQLIPSLATKLAEQGARLGHSALRLRPTR